VLDTGTHRVIKPQAAGPLQADRTDQAREQMMDWMGSLWFAPERLLEYARKGRAMNGIYVPYWTFDADTASAIPASAANTTTKPAPSRQR
jgi:hypothetical protein